jgi:hypothetical protein|tara:strand:- start:141 stop:551 length:411 start_codon:yes stop_codon:yes gene_type:complete
MSEEKPSERIVEQRVRNRIMEEIWGLSKGDINVAAAGPTEWFESFFDWFPYDGEPDWYPAMTAKEATAVKQVCILMQQAILDSDIPKNPTVDEICQTGWPQRIAPVAKQALDLMLARGRFSEDDEEVDPSSPVSWP